MNGIVADVEAYFVIIGSKRRHGNGTSARGGAGSCTSSIPPSPSRITMLTFLKDVFRKLEASRGKRGTAEGQLEAIKLFVFPLFFEMSAASVS